MMVGKVYSIIYDILKIKSIDLIFNRNEDIYINQNFANNEG